MSMLRPLDPAFPIQQQLATEASLVVPINLFTVDAADEQALLASCDRRQLRPRELRRLGIDSPVPSCLQSPGVPVAVGRLSVNVSCFASSVPEDRGARALRRLTPASDRMP